MDFQGGRAGRRLVQISLGISVGPRVTRTLGRDKGLDCEAGRPLRAGTAFRGRPRPVCFLLLPHPAPLHPLGTPALRELENCSFPRSLSAVGLGDVKRKDSGADWPPYNGFTSLEGRQLCPSLS